MTPWVRVVATGLVASVLGTVVKSEAEGVLQPFGEKLFPPADAQKIELGADPSGHPENMPPSEVADRVQHLVTGTELTDEQRLKAAAPLHWGMGVGGGVAYALIAHRYPRARAGFGTLFGVTFFAATHGSLLPLAGLQHPPATLPKAWWIWEGGSHVVYAVTIDSAIRVLDRLGEIVA